MAFWAGEVARVTIHHWHNQQEAEAIEALCRWQGIGCETFDEATKEVMVPTSGRGTPVVFEGGVQIAIGFREFYRHLDNRGYWCC